VHRPVTPPALLRRLGPCLALALAATPVRGQAPASPPRTPPPDSLLAAVREYRQAHAGAIVRELVELVSIPNLATDSANIHRNAHHIAAMLERRGVRARLLGGEGGPPAVYGELAVPGATRTVVLYAHYDGQPVDTTQWVTPPWKPVLRDRAQTEGGREIALPSGDRIEDAGSSEWRLYARSASDDKSPIVMMLAALDALRAAGVQPSVNVKFFFEGEEEAGSSHLRAVLERNADLLKGDAWLFGDGPVHQTGQMQVVFGVRGSMGLELTTYGPARALHSGHYGNWAQNPVTLLANLIASMRDDDGRIKIAGFSRSVRPLGPAERRAVAEAPPVDSALRHSLALARSEAGGLLAERVALPALNLRGFEGGRVGALAANAIATEARASIDFRLVPDQTPEEVRTLVERHVRAQGYFVTHDSVTLEMRRAHPKVVRMEWEGGYPGIRTPMDLPVSRAVLRVVRGAASRPVVTMPTLGGSLPMYLFSDVLETPLIVVPTVNYDNNQHAANENVRLGNVFEGVDVYAMLLARLGREWR
jgi:acetylornithine deacetylase/succinyl-diaminopimelate desuccinylase-like protein